MGRGVFADDFKGTGGTFLISGTLCTQDDYNAYLADFGDTGEDAEEPMSYESWSQQEVDDQYQGLIDTIRAVASTFELGITATKGSARDAHAGFDRDFALLLDAGPVHVGLRGWEHDYVVGAGANGGNGRGYDTIMDKVSDPSSYGADQLAEGYIAGEFSARAKALADDLLTYVRLELMDDGFECRYRTSGYTSSLYSKPEQEGQVRSALAEQIKSNLAYFNAQHPMEALVATREGRIALTKQVREILNGDENYGAVKVRVPLYYPDQENVAYFDAFEISEYSDAMCVYNADMSADLLATFEPQDGECDQFTLYHIPRNEHTEAWFAEQQQHIDKARPRDNIVIVSADEFFAATGMPIPDSLDEELEDEQRPSP